MIGFRSFGDVHRFSSCLKQCPLGESRAFILRFFPFLRWTFYPIPKRNHRLKKKRSCRSLAIANDASERKLALIEIIRKSSRLLLESDCLSSQKKKIVFAANFAIDSNLLWTESRGVCSEIFKMVKKFLPFEVEVQERLLAFFQFANSVTFKGHLKEFFEKIADF